MKVLKRIEIYEHIVVITVYFIEKSHEYFKTTLKLDRLRLFLLRVCFDGSLAGF